MAINAQPRFSMKSPASLCWWLAFGAFALTAPACKKNVTAPPVAGLALAPIEKTRSSLVLTATIPSLDRSLNNAGALTGTMQLPTTADDLRPMALAWIKMPPSVLTRLDLGKPLAMAMVAQDEPGTSPHIAVAGHVKTEQDAHELIKTIGKITAREQDAVQVQPPEGAQLWLLPRKNIVIAAENLAALVAAGTQATSALTGGQGDLHVKVQVAAAVAASGKDLKIELEKVRSQALAEARKQRSNQPQPDLQAMDEYLAQTFDLYIGWLIDTDALDLTLSLQADDGLRLSAQIHPKKGSGLAKQFADTTPAVLDPALQAGPAPAALFAWHPSPGLQTACIQLITALELSKIAGGKAFAQATKKILGLVSGASSGRVDVENNRLVYSTVAPLAPGANPEAVMAGLDALFKPDALPAFVRALDPTTTPNLQWSRKGKQGEFLLDYPAGPETKAIRDVLRSLFGSEKLAMVVTANDKRLIGATEPGADRRLAAFNGSTTAGPSPEVKQLLADTHGDSGFWYVDLLATARPAIAVAATRDPSAAQAGAMLNLLPGLNRLRVPLITRFRGGEHLLVQLYIPLRTFESIGAVVGPLRGLGLGGALVPDP